MDLFVVSKIFILTTVSFIFAISITPLVTHFLYKYRLGKKIRDSQSAPVMAQLHAHKAGTPTMGGVIVWFSVLFVALVFYYLDSLTSIKLFDHMNFLTRSQTYLPIGAMVIAALVGLLDDFLNVRGIGPKGGGLSLLQRIILFTGIALVAAFWFYFKLDWDLLRIPFVGNYQIGLWYIPLAVLVMVATTFSVNETDGLDGLAGGVLATSFVTFGGIAFAQGRYDLAAFCGVIVGALLAFLWFNVMPARFYMGDTGAMALGITLAIVAMLTNSILILPVVCAIMVMESGSVIIQLTSKKFRNGKKVFLSTPIHHHFEAIGWSEGKIVFRFWIISAVCAAVGLVIALIDRGGINF